jgi:ketosteroid isomerase-like protein
MMGPLTEATAREIANEWIDSWNTHDLNKILSHYTDSFEMQSPFILKMYPESGGKLVGKAAVGEYWERALQKYSDLHFELLDVMFSVDSMCIVYKSVNGLRAVEWLQIETIGDNNDWKISKAAGHYHTVP